MSKTSQKLASSVTSKRDPVRKRGGNFQPQILHDLAELAITAAQSEAFHTGKIDAQTGRRDHAPYGFSDLKRAWKAGFVAASTGGKRDTARERGR